MKPLIGICLLALLWANPAQAAPPDTTQLRAQGLAVIQQFFSQLKDELRAGLKRGGPGAAIVVCRSQAPAIARRVGEKNGWQVGRTSLLLRNPANAPDPWEAKVLADFAAQAQTGTSPGKLVYSEVVTDALGRRVFRLMKGIPMGGGCLVCHGPSPAPAALKQLRLLYPQDKATGFRPGDLRGAFTLRKALD